MNFCNIVIGGHLGKDAEQFSTNSGQIVTRFSVGVNVGFGERRNTNWFECAMWGDRGSKLLPYLKKGKAVVISGELNMTTREYQGRLFSSMNVNVDNLSFAGDRDSQQQTQQQEQTQAPQQQEPYQAEFSDNEDVPF